MRGRAVFVAGGAVRSARHASAVTNSSCTAGGNPEITYLPPTPETPGSYRTLAPARQARLIALNALFSAGLTASAAPVPVMRPGGGTIAFAIGSESNPIPGALSKAAASCADAMLYGIGRICVAGAAATNRIFARTSAPMAVFATMVRTPICSGSVHPAASCGVSSGPPETANVRILCGSSTSRASAANS